MKKTATVIQWLWVWKYLKTYNLRARYISSCKKPRERLSWQISATLPKKFWKIWKPLSERKRLYKLECLSEKVCLRLWGISAESWKIRMQRIVRQWSWLMQWWINWFGKRSLESNSKWYNICRSAFHPT